MSAELDDDTRAALAALHEHYGEDPLDPDLLPYLTHVDDGWSYIKHPLVFSIAHVPMLNRSVNRQLANKRLMIAQYREAGDWHGIVSAHERPYRLSALLSLAGDVTDDEWWDLVAFVWIDSENIRECAGEWEAVLRSDRPGRAWLMDEDERAAFDALPETVTIWQGCTNLRDDGWSWTTERATAEWFARRFARLENGRPRLRKGRVRRADISAYFLRRNESEVLVDPALVTVLTDRRLSAKPSPSEARVVTEYVELLGGEQ